MDGQRAQLAVDLDIRQLVLVAIFEEDERVYDIKEALTKIDRADFIIFSLYMEMQSERKVAKQLGVSRTPINRAIKRIKQQIRDLMDDVD